jgi:hypothetical protein
MQCKEDFDWFMNTVLCGHSSYWNNDRNDTFCDEKFGVGVIFDVVSYCFH